MTAEQKKYFGATLGWHWLRTGLALLLFAEYTRLVLTTEAPSYRVIITVLLGLVSAFFLIVLVRAHRRKARD